MVEISATLVKELRDQTGAPMMDCKRALQETNGDMEAALRVLREKGMAGAAKRSGRETPEGKVGYRLAEDARREVVDQGVAAQAVEVFIRAHIRYAGTDTALVVPAFSLHAPHEESGRPSLAAMKSAFEAAHKARFGFIAAMCIASLRASSSEPPRTCSSTPILFRGGWA